MNPSAGQLVFTADKRLLGPVIEIERDRARKLTGIVVRRDDDQGLEARFPAAWIARIYEERIELTVTGADITPVSMDLTFPDEASPRLSRSGSVKIDHHVVNVQKGVHPNWLQPKKRESDHPPVSKQSHASPTGAS